MSGKIKFKAGDRFITLPNKKWLAFHDPAGEEKDSMTFDTEKEAEKHILEYVKKCDYCKKKVRFRKNEMWYTPCGCEWSIMKTADFMRCETFEDHLVASGLRLIYSADKKGEDNFKKALKKFGVEGKAISSDKEAGKTFFSALKK